MANPTEPRREHPSTYVVQDRSSEEEMNRLRIQDQMVTTSMGGVLPEQPDPSLFHRVLDVGCGAGGWVIEAAQNYPAMSLFGIDISKTMTDYAREQARIHGVGDRVEFRVMDALRMLEFPPNYFDLVNLRFSVSFQRKWDWPKMLSELQRVTRPGGIVRVTENEIIHESNSPALMQWFEMLQCALFHAGHLFEQESTSVTNQLVPLLKQHGVQQVQAKPYPLEYRAGTEAGQIYYENWMHAFRTLRPFLQKWGCAPQGYEATCQRALVEMQQPGFVSTLRVLTVWGKSR